MPALPPGLPPERLQRLQEVRRWAFGDELLFTTAGLNWEDLRELFNLLDKNGSDLRMADVRAEGHDSKVRHLEGRIAAQKREITSLLGKRIAVHARTRGWWEGREALLKSQLAGERARAEQAEKLASERKQRMNLLLYGPDGPPTERKR